MRLGFAESFTADHKPLLGEDINVRGFFHGCGLNSLGMNGSGGVGRELANWILDGRPQLDMYAYDIRSVQGRTNGIAPISYRSKKVMLNWTWIRDCASRFLARSL